MLNRSALLNDLQKLLKKLEEDLLERSESVELAEIGLKLREEFTAAQAAARTAQNYEDFRSDAITQAAAAWVLSCVFVRFLEDNDLVPTPRIAGPGERLARARDEHESYFHVHPAHTDRDYLLGIFDGLQSHAATAEIFGVHNPIRDLLNWLSGDAAGALIAFFQKIDPNSGALVHDFTDSEWDTRFLGDLYQDLSEAARKKYALLQTPVFVEEFILDRTLDPAIEEFGLAKMGYETRLLPDGRLHPDDRFKMIDPACGSGHFLLGSFARLVDRWRRREPGTKTTVLVQRALDSVHGVDLNPYAVAIARFRLLLAALKECGIRRLSDAPGFEIHLACGDSLLHGYTRGEQSTMGWAPTDHVYRPEDRQLLARLLRPKTYHAVVANPPYITPKDVALNTAYRDRHTTCYRQYSLAVPFLERIFSLAVAGGHTGQITANSFMKREFGKRLVEDFLAELDLTHVIDTSLAAIPGHGTPTVILLGRQRTPLPMSTVRAALAIQREDNQPEDPARGKVWSAILNQIDLPGSEGEYVTVVDWPRERFARHPWSIGGGGAAELKAEMDKCATTTLALAVELPIGRAVRIAEEEAFIFNAARRRNSKCSNSEFREYLIGELIRDWVIGSGSQVWYPYVIDSENSDMIRELGPWRTTLANRATFQGKMADAGRMWWEYMQHTASAYFTNKSISFSFMATHNHFALDRGGRVFQQSAPIIKLPAQCSDGDHYGLLGVLNSSAACFWMKQVFYDKGGGGIGGGVAAEAWERFMAMDGTKLRELPLPRGRPTALASRLDNLAQRLLARAPSGLLADSKFYGGRPTDGIGTAITVSERDWRATREQMIFLQEELDWECYRLYGLIEEELTQSRKAAKGHGTDLDAELPAVPPLELGQRAFEIVMARKMAADELQTTWFERHGSTPITELPADWPDDYRRLVERRIELIESDPNIRLIEQPEYKRRWNTEPWESQLERALNSWLLDRLESYFDFDGRMNDEGKPTARLPIKLTTAGRLADVARQDTEFLEVGEFYRGDQAFDLSGLVAELVDTESVPLLPVLRYKPSGLRKRLEWTQTWDLQRQEDAIDARCKLAKNHADYLTEIEAAALKKKEVGTIAVPPKYTSADFLKSHYWRLRGKLDVPKERWVSFPGCEGEDGTLVIAWAGYDHLQLARAISANYVDVEERLGTRDDPRLVPLLACLIELLPWLKQWHNEVDSEFGMRMGDYFEGFLQEEARKVGKTVEEIKGWEPVQRARGKRSRGKSARDNVE